MSLNDLLARIAEVGVSRQARLSDWVDDTYRDYVLLAQYREAVASSKPNVTGYVSACCESGTRVRNDRLVCIVCDRPCEVRSWYSPITGSSSKGGWSPSKAVGIKAMHEGWNLVYINETRVRHIAIEDARRARGTDRIHVLASLFEPRPLNMTIAAWKRSLYVWRHWLDARSYKIVADYSVILLGVNPEVWTEGSVGNWIDEARSTILSRLKGRGIGRTGHHYRGPKRAAA